MQQALFSGIIQGITEWIPMSSEGILLLFKKTFFDSGDTSALFRYILFLHLGTFFAALLYFRKKIGLLLWALFCYRSSDLKTQKTLTFLMISTLISGTLGIIFLRSFISFYDSLAIPSRILNLIIGVLLLITAVLQIKIKPQNLKAEENITLKDSLVLGIAQAFSVLPGLSRSGLTISFLLLRKFNKTTALQLSFLMSLPIVLGGNIVLNFKSLHLSAENLVALGSSFIVGLLTIHGLLKIAERINFGYFVLFFALLVLMSCLF